MSRNIFPKSTCSERVKRVRDSALEEWVLEWMRMLRRRIIWI